MSIPDGLTPEMIQQMVENPGQTLSGSSIQLPEVRKATTSVDISKPAAKGVRPRIPGNSVDATQDRISRPSARLATRLHDGWKAQQQELRELKQKEAEAREMDPSNLHARIGHLERQLKKLNTNLNKLIKAQENG